MTIYIHYNLIDPPYLPLRWETKRPTLAKPNLSPTVAISEAKPASGAYQSVSPKGSPYKIELI